MGTLYLIAFVVARDICYTEAENAGVYSGAGWTYRGWIARIAL